MARSQRPLIGVTGPDEGGDAAWWFTRFALWRAGGRVRRITPSRDGRSEELDGLVIGGGADVAPALYGVEPPSLAEAMEEDAEQAAGGAEEDEEDRNSLPRRIVALLTLLLRRLLARKSPGPSGDPARDELESRLIGEAIRSGKPLLGICRGAQLLNVHLGGTLHQALDEFYVETPQVTTVRPRKTIEIEPGSRLADVLRTERCRVNALHRQAVDRVAEELRIVAREESGVVQAIEHPERDFVIGVQWHPEYLPQVKRQRRIFARLVDAARKCAEA